jgi:hypothetical protein
MKYIIVLVVCVAAIFALPHFAMAQTEVLAQAGSTAPATQSYQELLKVCGAEWRASEQRKAVTKGEGQKAWNTYRAECVTRHGYVPKRTPKAKG